MKTEVLYNGTLGDVTVEGNIEPVLAAFTIFILGPLGLYFATFPGEDENNAGHSEFEWVVFFELHAQDLCLA